MGHFSRVIPGQAGFPKREFLVKFCSIIFTLPLLQPMASKNRSLSTTVYNSADIFVSTR